MEMAEARTYPEPRLHISLYGATLKKQLTGPKGQNQESLLRA